MKKVRFNDNIVIYEIPYECRFNFDLIDKQRFKTRILEFEKIFIKINPNKWRTKYARAVKSENR